MGDAWVDVNLRMDTKNDLIMCEKKFNCSKFNSHHNWRDIIYDHLIKKVRIFTLIMHNIFIPTMKNIIEKYLQEHHGYLLITAH